MADTSLFSRLRRLFSNDVIIRNVGGKQLKIMDSGQIQKYGNLASRGLNIVENTNLETKT